MYECLADNTQQGGCQRVNASPQAQTPSTISEVRCHPKYAAGLNVQSGDAVGTWSPDLTAGRAAESISKFVIAICPGHGDQGMDKEGNECTVQVRASPWVATKQSL